MPHVAVQPATLVTMPTPTSTATLTTSTRFLHICGQMPQDVNGDVVGVVMATGARIHDRLGGLRPDQITAHDGQR